MPLITCPDCERQVSTRAAHCPGCGSPVQPPAAEAVEAAEPAAPQVRAEARQPTRQTGPRLFTTSQIRAAAFFGTILCAAHLISANWRRLGRPDAGSTVWLASIALFAAMLVVGVLTPTQATTHASLASTIFYIALAERLHKKQSEAIAARGAMGASSTSNRQAAAIILAYTVAVLAIVVGLHHLP